MRGEVIALISIALFSIGLLIFTFWALPPFPKEMTVIENIGRLLVTVLSELGVILLCFHCMSWVIKK